MIIDPNTLANNERYKLMTGSVLPRPIAWVSSQDNAGRLNLAPFSYFTAVCTDPMTLLFCTGWSGAHGRMKDTYNNIQATGEFVINIVNETTKEAMNLSATEFEADVNEFEWAGVTPAASQSVRVPRVAESPLAFECHLQQTVMIKEGPGGGAAIFGTVHSIYIADHVYANGRISLEALQPIGRLAGSRYAHMNDLFELKRVPPPAGG